MVGIRLLFWIAHIRGPQKDLVAGAEYLLDGSFRLLVLVGQLLRGLSIKPVISQDGPMLCQADILVQAVVYTGVQRVFWNFHFLVM